MVSKDFLAFIKKAKLLSRCEVADTPVDTLRFAAGELDTETRESVCQFLAELVRSSATNAEIQHVWYLTQVCMPNVSGSRSFTLDMIEQLREPLYLSYSIYDASDPDQLSLFGIVPSTIVYAYELSDLRCVKLSK